MLLETAFSVQFYQMVGFDQFVRKIPSLYVIEARSDEDADKRLANLPKAQCKAEQQHMLQALLIDRFHLKFHWEDRLLPGYRLLIAKRGSKLLPAGYLPMDARGRGEDGKPVVFHQRRDDLGGTVYMGRGASLADLVRLISALMKSPVQDETGLDGKYDFDLRLLARTTEDDPQENPQDQMAEAVQDQLGLRLEAAPLMQKMLVIDHMEAPSPN
jgi:uncharacterized protein (TIGR03435 family)